MSDYSPSGPLPEERCLDHEATGSSRPASYGPSSPLAGRQGSSQGRAGPGRGWGPDGTAALSLSLPLLWLSTITLCLGTARAFPIRGN